MEFPHSCIAFHTKDGTYYYSLREDGSPLCWHGDRPALVVQDVSVRDVTFTYLRRVLSVRAFYPFVRLASVASMRGKDDVSYLAQDPDIRTLGQHALVLPSSYRFSLSGIGYQETMVCERGRITWKRSIPHIAAHFEIRTSTNTDWARNFIHEVGSEDFLTVARNVIAPGCYSLVIEGTVSAHCVKHVVDRIRDKGKSPTDLTQDEMRKYYNKALLRRGDTEPHFRLCDNYGV